MGEGEDWLGLCEEVVRVGGVVGVYIGYIIEIRLKWCWMRERDQIRRRDCMQGVE